MSAHVKDYYDTRAPEYDEWYQGRGKFAQRDRPAWFDDVEALTRAIARLPPAVTLDVACGTGFLTCHLRGDITAVDQSEQMLAITRDRIPAAAAFQADAFALGFADDSFDRIFTGHFYGHLGEEHRKPFLAQARRLAPELVIVDSTVRPDHEPEEWQERVLNDGSRFQVFKRYFEAEALAAELGGGTVLHRGPWFVMVCSRG